jgi:hypothetical protein
MLAGKIAYFRPTGFDPRDLPGLVAYWPMSEDATLTNAQALDVGGSGFHLTSSGALSNPGRNGSGRLLSATGTQWNPTPARLSRGSYNATPQFDANVAGWSVAFWVFTDLTYGTQGTGSTAAGINFSSIASAGAEIPRFSGGNPANGFAAISSRCYFTDNSFVAYQTGINIPGGMTSVTPQGQWTHLAFVADPTTRTYTMYVNGVARTPVTYAAGKVLSSFSSGMPCIIQWPGTIDELVVYNRAITASEVQRLAGVPLAPSAASTLHPECRSWISRVLSNGGTVSTSTANAVNTFCNAIDSAGLRDRFYRLNLFAGTGLSAALVPLYRGQSLGGTQFGGTTDTNTNFTSTDYSETTGLLNATGTKFLSTGVTSSQLPASSGHVSWSYTNNSFAATGFAWGTIHNTGAYRTYCFISNASSQSFSVASGNFSEVSSFASAYGRWLASRTSLSMLSAYRNGSGIANDTRTVTATTGGTDQFLVFRSAGGSGSRFGMNYYGFGESMTAAQAASFDSAVSAFLTALGRS